jgi:molecular chaperone DnaK (HSP70)
MAKKKSYYPEEITAFLLEYLKETAQDYLSGVKISKVVVSVPVYFNDLQRQVTIDACEMAGFEVIGLVSEPTAAALAYPHFIKGSPKRFTSLVFDLGGGTLDISVQVHHYGNLKVLAKSGDTRLGGNDFNQRILYHFLGKIREVCDYDFFNNKSALYLLNIESEKCKQHLTFNQIYENRWKYNEFEIDLSLKREKFEELCEDLFESIRNRLLNFLRYGTTQLEVVNHPLFDQNFIDQIQISETELNKIRIRKDELILLDEKIILLKGEIQEMENSSLKHKVELGSRLERKLYFLKEEKEEFTAEILKTEEELSKNDEFKQKINDYIQNKQIDYVFIAGESSKIPKIKSILEEIFENEKLISILNAKTVVACGSSIRAAFNYIDLVSDWYDYRGRLQFFDSLPFSIGIENMYGDMDTLIDKNQSINYIYHKIYTENLKVSYDHKNIPSIQVKVYEGEEKQANKNHFLDQLELRNFKVPYKIKISLGVDSRNIITLKLKDISRGLFDRSVESTKILANLDGRLAKNDMIKLKSVEETKRFLDNPSYYFNSNKKKMSYRELLEIFEKSLIKPIKQDILNKFEDLKKAGDKIDISFEFPFTDCNSRVESVELLRIFDSQAKPKLLNCLPMNKHIIYKTGDNLYDDQICMAFLSVFNAIWQYSNQNFTWTRSTGNISKSTNYQIFNKCYKIVPTDDPLKKSGLIECIGGVSAEDIWNRNPFYRSPQHKYNDLVNGLRPGGEDYTRLMASAIGTFVSMFVLGIGDRHQGNMMVANDHSFFNIDFGFTFGETPFIDTADFPIPFFLRDYIKNGNEWNHFVDQLWLARKALVEYTDLIDFLVMEFSKDKVMYERIKKTLSRTLNTNMWKSKFKFAVGKGSIAKLPKDISHELANRINSQPNIETKVCSSTQTETNQ